MPGASTQPKRFHCSNKANQENNHKNPTTGDIMNRNVLCICLGLLLAAASWAQSPNYDYPYFVNSAEGIIVNGNVYDIPTFGDWDCDGDQDLMVGVFYNGNIWYYQNTAGAGQPPVLAAHTMVQADGSNISVTYG
jgi:hypothetical protein